MTARACETCSLADRSSSSGIEGVLFCLEDGADVAPTHVCDAWVQPRDPDFYRKVDER